MQKNILEYLEKTVENKYYKIGYSDKDNSLTFKEIIELSKKIGSYIVNKRSDMMNAPIAVMLPKNIYMLICFHGITYSGNIYVPIDISQPVERIKNILNILEPALIIVNNETKKLLINTQYSHKMLDFDEALCFTIDDEKLRHIREKQISTDPLYIIFTSGSTGLPKGVLVNHQSVIDYINWVSSTFNFTDNDIIANQAPFYFDNSVLDIYTTMKIGNTLYIMQEKNFAFPAKILAELKQHNITTIFWVPSVLISIANSGLLDNFQYDKFNKILFAGEVMPNKHLNIWRKYLPNVVYANLYGPTEITVDCLYYIVDRDFNDDDPLPIGNYCNNTDIIILNKNNNTVEQNEIGEICVRGISLAMGYYNDFEKTRDVFIQNPLNKHYPELIYRTGDLGYYNEFNEVIYVGRKDGQIKHHGYRIELGEIEIAVLSAKNIHNACALYDYNKSEILLFYTADTELEIKDIRTHLLELIPKYAIPSKLIYLNEMPMTNNGKIDRQSLKNKFLGE